MVRKLKHSKYRITCPEVFCKKFLVKSSQEINCADIPIKIAGYLTLS